MSNAIDVAAAGGTGTGSRVDGIRENTDGSIRQITSLRTTNRRQNEGNGKASTMLDTFRQNGELFFRVSRLRRLRMLL